MRYCLAALGSALLVATPALAQSDATTLPDPYDNSNTFSIALVGAYLPDYEGSNDYEIVPAPVIRGRVGGHSFHSQGTYLYFNLIPNGRSKLSFDFGPIAGVRLNRNGRVDDPVVNLLPRRKAAIEVGAFGGITLRGLTNPYDSLVLHVDAVHDIGGSYGSTVVTPSASFSTPVSRRTYFSLSASADFTGRRYAQYYYSITPAESATTGLPVFDPHGGYKDWSVSLTGVQSLTGDLTHGFSLVGLASYSRLQNDFARAPIVSLRGSPSQWIGAVGVAYTW